VDIYAELYANQTEM